MILLLIFVMMMLGLFGLFLGGGLVAQGYLYQNPAEKMPLRAIAGAALVAGFVTLWVWIDQRAPGRYDTFFNFASYSTKEFDEFESVRWMGVGGKLKLDQGNYVETTAKFKRGKDGKFYEEGKPSNQDNEFKLRGYTADGRLYLTGAIRVKGPDDAEPVRYNAVLEEGQPKEEPRFASTATTDRRFEEAGGSRYINFQQMGTMFIPSTGTIAAALLLNFMLVVVWMVAFWPILRFSFLHAAVFTALFALLTMLAIMPVLFKQNRIQPKPTTAPATAMLRQCDLLAPQAATAR